MSKIRITETVTDKTFGQFYDMEKLRKEDGKYPTSIIVAVRGQGGLKPVYLCLPHQLYLRKAKALLEEYKEKELFVFPVYDSTEWSQVLPYEHQLWHDAKPGDLWELEFKFEQNTETVTAIVSASEPYNRTQFYIHRVGWVSLQDENIISGTMVHRVDEEF